MKPFIFAALLLLSLESCQQEEITIGKNADETFYVQNNQASMRVNVSGNTASKTFMVVVHGGPGGTSFLYQIDAVQEIIESEFAVVYWDQRISGASQGSTTKPLTIAQFGEDLKKVIQTIKHRYGQDASVFILGHSWGGMVTSSFVTNADNQQLIKGWIFANASHDYPMNDSLTRIKLLTFGREQVLMQRNVDKWNTIIKFCEENQDARQYDNKTHQLINDYAWDAIDMIDGFTPLNSNEVIRENLVTEHIPFTSAFVNLINPTMKDLDRNIRQAEFSSQLHKVTIPVLICAGDYDFVCPEGLGDDVFKRIRSTQKEKILFSRSGHNLEETEAYSQAFARFMRKHR